MLSSPYVLCARLSSALTSTGSSSTHLPSHLLTLPPLGKHQGHRPTVSPENKPNGKTFYKTTALYSSKVSKAGKTKKD